jgi:prepilin-type N-terminal cleavage/methylation domain-containing protein/prepilin-type processing-associated H-X9-DG protein
MPVTEDKCMNHKRNAFTLIELLVVIAIISILAAILFPVFATAREKARQTTCATNQKNIGLAMLQYSQDYDEYLPWARLYNSTTSYWSWDMLVAPYVHMGNQYSFAGNWQWMTGANAPWAVCPDDTVTHAQGNPPAYLQPRSYSMIAAWNGTGSQGQQLSKIESPSTSLLLTESICRGNNVGDYHCTTVSSPATQWDCNTNPPTSVTYAAGGHNGGWNYTFCDGHVKWMDPKQTIGAGGNLTSNGNGPRGMWTIDPND